MTIQELETQLETTHGLVLTLTLSHNLYLEIASIVVPKAKRNRGIGTKVMQSICTYADENGLIVGLTPSTDFGATSIERLRKFYGRFGFIRNLGRLADLRISEAMIRVPR